jgi:hypothetical protein
VFSRSLYYEYLLAINSLPPSASAPMCFQKGLNRFVHFELRSLVDEAVAAFFDGQNAKARQFRSQGATFVPKLPTPK